VKPRHIILSTALMVAIVSSAAALTLMRSGNATLSASDSKLVATSPQIAALGRIEPIAEDRDIAAVITGKIKAVNVALPRHPRPEPALLRAPPGAPR
jgi:multidrug efflux pump subunit AcrA (membrane-fusion protein)